MSVYVLVWDIVQFASTRNVLSVGMRLRSCVCVHRQPWRQHESSTFLFRLGVCKRCRVTTRFQILQFYVFWLFKGTRSLYLLGLILHSYICIAKHTTRTHAYTTEHKHNVFYSNFTRYHTRIHSVCKVNIGSMCIMIFICSSDIFWEKIIRSY